MIHGDIDLTENLDFYRDKIPKQLPNIVPWNDIRVEYTNEQHPLIVYDRDLDLIEDIDYRGVLEYQNFQITHDLSQTYTTSSTNTIRFSYRNQQQMFDLYYNYMFDLYYNYIDDYDISHTISKTIKTVIFDDMKNNMNHFNIPFASKPKKNIKSVQFNKKNDYLTFHGLLPWVSKYDKFKLNRFRQTSMYIDSDDLIPWDKKTSENYPKKERECPWYKKLDYRIYEDYVRDLFEEADYTSYLTNMGWIGIYG